MCYYILSSIYAHSPHIPLVHCTWCSPSSFFF
jgi:hypothetical protein